MLPYKTEAGPRRQLKQQDKLRPPAAGRLTVTTASLLPLTHLIIASCVQSPLWVGGHDWREHGADNLAQIVWHDTLSKCLHSEVCLRDCELVTNDRSGHSLTSPHVALTGSICPGDSEHCESFGLSHQGQSVTGSVFDLNIYNPTNK